MGWIYSAEGNPPTHTHNWGANTTFILYPPQNIGWSQMEPRTAAATSATVHLLQSHHFWMACVQRCEEKAPKLSLYCTCGAKAGEHDLISLGALKLSSTRQAAPVAVNYSYKENKQGLEIEMGGEAPGDGITKGNILSMCDRSTIPTSPTGWRGNGKQCCLVTTQLIFQKWRHNLAAHWNFWK